MEALLAAIHAVNPTGRGRSVSQTAADYEEKARLQSALIARFSDALWVRREADPAVVALNLRGGANAGHARLDALSPDARAWVQRRLDTEAHTAPPPPAAAPPAWIEPTPEAAEPTGGPLGAGRAALAAYDFPAAEAAFRAALPAPEAVAGLMEIWVDWLADDARALALWRSHGAGADAETRGRAAVAAARLGDRASVCAVSPVGPRAAEAWAWLGQGAVQAGRIAQGDADLAAARAADPGHPAVAALAAALADRRAEARASAEADLADLSGAAQVARARAVLVDHPDSAAARAILQAAEAAAQAAARAAAVARVAEAEGPGPRLAALRQAAALGVDVGAALAEAEADLAAQALAREGAEVRAAFAHSADDEGPWLAWCALGREGRAQVPAPAPVAEWIEALLGEGARPRAAVRAALALRASEAEPPAAASDRLRPHRRLLAVLPAYARVAARGEAQAQAQRRAAAQAGLAAAWAQADPAAALAALQQVDLAALTPPARQAAGAFAQAVQRRAQRAALADRFEARVGEGDLLGARSTLDRLLATRPDDLGLRTQLSALDVAVAKAWHYTVLHPHEGDALPDLVDGLGTEGCVVALDGRGRAVLPTTHGPYLFVRWVRLADGDVTRAVVLRLPAEGAVLDVAVDPAGVQIITRAGVWLRIAADGARLLDHATIPLGGGDELEVARAQPGTDRVWLTPAVGRPEGLGWVEPAGGVHKTVRPLASPGLALSVTGQGVVFQDSEGALEWHGAEGARQRSPAQRARIHGLAAAAQGPRWQLAETRDGGAVVGPVGGPERALSPAQLSWRHAIATDGAVAYVHAGDGRRWWLWAVAVEGAQITVRWQVRAPRALDLLTDAASSAVVALADCRVHPLTGEQAPPLASQGRWQPKDVSWSARPCLGLPVARRARVTALRRLLEARSPATRRAWVDQQVAHELSPNEVVDLYHAARQVTAGLADRVAEQGLARWPAHAGPRLISAERLARLGQWGRVGALLSPVTPGPDEADIAAHFHHLLGLSLLYAGAEASAAEAWRAGLAHPGADVCELAALAADAAGDGAGPGSDYVRLMRAVRAADAARAAGDFDRAIEVLDQPQVWALRHPQALARLTEAVLEVPARDDGAWLRKARVIATYASAVAAEGAHPAPLAAERWVDDRLDDLRTQARLWLSPAPATY